MAGSCTNARFLLAEIIANTTAGAAMSTPRYEPDGSDASIAPNHGSSVHDRQIFSQYTPLNESECEIRILTLHGGDDSDAPLQCALEVLPLELAGDFIALSYCWGAPGNSVVISVNGEDVAIQVNLWTFLHRLWSIRGRSRVWVDYLCINQNDYQEKGPQVKLMANVFGAAAMVYAWLGESTPQIDQAVATLEEARKLHAKAPGEDNLRIYASARRLMHPFLASREYWTRIWIVQEVLLARSLWLMIGTSLIDYSTFDGLDRDYMSIGRDTTHACDQIWAYRRYRPSTFSLQDLVRRFCTSECDDPRDRIYGMLGALTSVERARACVDYNVSVLQAMVNNQHLLFLDSEGGIDPGNYRDVMMAICPDRLSKLLQPHGKDMHSSSLPRLPMGLAFRGGVSSSMSHTVAAVRVQEKKVVSLTSDNVDQKFDLYIVLLRQDMLRDVALYTTAIPQDDDFVLDLDTSYLIIRQCGDQHRVVGVAIDSQDTWIDPKEWVDTISPVAEFTLSGSPIHTTVVGLDRYFWKVHLNGAALAQMVVVPYLKSNTGPWLDEASYDLISESRFDKWWHKPKGLGTQHTPKRISKATVSAASNMLPIRFQDPNFLPGLRRDVKVKGSEHRYT